MKKYLAELPAPLVARDQLGNSAVTVFQIRLSRADGDSAGRASLSDKLAQARNTPPAWLTARSGHGQ